MEQQIAILGCGGLAREVAYVLEANAAAGGRQRAVAYVDRDQSPLIGTELNGLPVLSLRQLRNRFPAALAVSGIGAPAARRRAVEEVAQAGLGFATVIHHGVFISRHTTIGEGCVICSNVSVTVNITLGPHAFINLGCTIGHDSVIGRYVNMSPGVNLSGNVDVGAEADLGTNASIINGFPDRKLMIGAGACIGAAACVTRDVEPGVTVVGIPAKPRVR